MGPYQVKGIISIRINVDYEVNVVVTVKGQNINVTVIDNVKA